MEVESISDEIKNYILSFKESNNVTNFISCENELMEIIDFFKVSEMEAVNFLSKSPNGNSEYTEDYIIRLNDLEKDIKVKENTDKDNILEKMKEFVLKLKHKTTEIEKIYEERNSRLVAYEVNMKKVGISTSVQTYEGYDRRVRELENRLREQEEKYSILEDIRKEGHSLQDEVHNIDQMLSIKINENKKLAQTNLELEAELHALMKIIRDKYEKNNLTDSDARSKKRG